MSIGSNYQIHNFDKLRMNIIHFGAFFEQLIVIFINTGTDVFERLLYNW